MENGSQNFRTILFFATVVAALCLAIPGACLAGLQKVLILHSYHQGLSWTDNLTGGMMPVLEGGDDLEIHVEYMDTKRHPPKDSFGFLEALYRDKYGSTRFDVILLSDNNALSFVVSRRETLFAGVPVVFCGINNYKAGLLRGYRDITGVTEDIDVAGTIRLARRLLPGLRNLVVVNDQTPTGLANQEKFQAAVNGGAGAGVSFEVWNDLTAKDLEKKLAGLADDSAVLLFTFHRDKAGQWFSIPEYLMLITEASTVPVFSFWDNYIGQGVMGGMMVYGNEQGRLCAEYAMRILGGEPPSSLPVLTKSPNIRVLDHGRLKKFSVGDGNIPPESVVLFEPESVFETYKQVIVASAVSFVVLLGMVAALSANILLRRQAMAALRRSEEALRISRDEVRQLNLELEERVRHRTIALEAANKELDAFAYSVSHDLRAPLRGIDGFSLALLEDYEEHLDDTARDYLNRVRSGCIRMGQLIDDLLKMSRLTRGEIRRNPLDMSRMARQSLEPLMASDPERRVDIRIRDDITGMGDETLIRAVLDNLLGNAWKFTGKTENPEISFRTETDGGRTVYVVKDNGAGFNPAYSDKLFSAFQRLHSPGEFEGTGIGLASVRRIIHRHGGRVWAKGEEGKGATFYFTLPRKE